MEFDKIAFISDFLLEFTEELNALENDIFELRRKQSDKNILDNVILHIQRLRSISTMMEFLNLENITSKLEKLFENIIDGRYKLSNDIVRLFITISEELHDTLVNIEKGQSDNIRYYDLIDINLQKAIDGEPFDAELKEYAREESGSENKEESENEQSIHVSINKINEVLQNFDKLIMREFRLKKLLYEIFDDNDGLLAQKNSRKIRQIKETVELIENQSFAIQDGVISMRKLPFNMILQPFKRAAVSESLKIGKNIAFDIPETDIKIDKSILERIPFILKNLVQNSLEHGIESEEERVAIGKPEYGTITINVQQMLNRIILTVSDDGRGIDFDKIKERAIQVYPENEGDILLLGSKNLIEYLFKPGISTKEDFDDSEKGVGLSGVREEIDRIKGKIKIDSKKDMGTSIEISMPLSLATQEGLFVMAGKYKLLILTHYIKEILTVKKDSFISIQSETVIPVRNELIPIYNSKAIFDGSSGDANKNEVSVVILEYLESKVAVVMDAILNYTTVVIKPLPRVFKKSKALQGVVFDEDYKIVPILNIPDLIRRFKIMNDYEMKKFEVQNAKKVYSVLIADSSLTTRQIEQDIFETEDYFVTTCGDGIDALEHMKEQHFDLIVTDMSMPRMDGYVFIHNVRHTEEYDSIPIIVLSSDVSESEKEKILSLGAQSFISKTNFKRENLIQTAKELLND